MKGRISKAGDPDVRCALYEAASAMLIRFKSTDTTKAWGLKLARPNAMQRRVSQSSAGSPW